MKTSPIPGFEPQLPHQRLIVYQRCVQLLLAVRAANIRDTKLRDEATRAIKGACLNIAEAASRKSRADAARTFAIARGEAIEACAAVEIAALSGDTSAEHHHACTALGREVYAMLTTLSR